MPTLTEVLTSRMRQFESQITGTQNADITTAISNLAALQIATAGATNTRDRAIRIEQTINSSGSITAVKYFMANGDTIEDTFTYGVNSLTEPTVAIRGSLILASSVSTSSSATAFIVASNGTTINYTVTGAPITALTGTLNVGGTNFPLTHVSSGVASISTAIQAGQAVSVTIANSTPTLITPVTNVAVANNSAQVSQKALTWSTTNGATISGDRVTLATTGSGSIATPSINSANYFEVITTVGASADGNALVVFLDDDATASYVWGGGQSYVLGNYISTTTYAVGENGSTALFTLPSATFPIKMRLSKSGNDLIASTSSDNGVTWTTRYTKAGALAASPTLYLKALLATGSSKFVDVQLFT